MSFEAVQTYVVDLVRMNAALAPYIVAVIAFAESVAIVSLFVPATVILVGVGALVAAVGLEFWPIWLGAAAGAVIGDWVSYALGYRFKHRALEVWPLSSHPGMVERGERFVLRWGPWGLFAGRFFGPVRAVAPLIAGVFAMPFVTFQAVNMASAMVWAFAMLAPGAGLIAVLQR